MATLAAVRDIPPRDAPAHMAMIGQSQAMQDVYRLIRQVAPSSANVLIYGETGTGKELVAHAIHAASTRSRQPFVVIDCASLPSELIETELFGHERGAFTGAHERHEGKFVQADRGTIFLDEISELPLKDQAKLLGVLQRREFTRIGGHGTIRVDIRVIAASNRPLMDAVKAKAFREDLYYRLNVVSMHLPPLRDRREDIPALVNHFLRKHSPPLSPCQITPRAMGILTRHDWPGNVRQLENTIEGLIALSGEGLIDANDLPVMPQPVVIHNTVDEKKEDLRLYTMLKGVEKAHIVKVLSMCHWNQTIACKKLGISRQTLLNKMHSLGIHNNRDFASEAIN